MHATRRFHVAQNLNAAATTFTETESETGKNRGGREDTDFRRLLIIVKTKLHCRVYLVCPMFLGLSITNLRWQLDAILGTFSKDFI